MLENIIGNAVASPTVSGLLSRPKFCNYGRDGFVRKAGRTALSVFSTSRPPALLENDASGCQSHNGATMHHAPRATTPTNPARPTSAPNPHQQRIEAALRAVANEVLPPVGTRPYSSDSYLPGHVIAMLTDGIKSLDAESASIERHQAAFNAGSTALWHLARGNTEAALSRLRRAATHAKAASGCNTTGV